jgi:hypothetical protein
MAMGGPTDSDGNGDGTPDATASPTRAPLLRRMVGEASLDIATTAEGRAAGLSVEIWPDQGAWLRTRSGDELRILVDDGDEVRVRWERRDAKPDGLDAEGALGPAATMTEDDLRTFVNEWLSERIRRP